MVVKPNFDNYNFEDMPVVLEGKNLGRIFGSRKKKIFAVNGVDFKFHQGEIISIVGESGSGKSTVMRILIGLLKQTSGELLYNGQLVDFKFDKLRRAYWQHVQAIFQDPFASFNQFFQVHRIFDDCLKFRNILCSREQAEEYFVRACNFVNLRYHELKNKYPFELSGGQMQRLMIARVFMLEPKVVIADEPTSMVDACSRSTILDMFLNLRRQNKMTIIFITHDVGLAYYISDSIYIMQKGRFVESGNARKVIGNPQEDYTKHLIADVPKLNQDWILEK